MEDNVVDLASSDESEEEIEWDAKGQVSANNTHLLKNDAWVKVYVADCRRGNSESYKCVGKVYKESNSYSSVKKVYDDFKGVIDNWGPSNIWFDDALGTMFMSYVQCPTLMRVLKRSVALEEVSSHEELERACAACERLLAHLWSFSVVHGDMHAENVLMCSSSDNSYDCKMIDFDSLRACKNDKECLIDPNMLINSIADNLLLLRINRRRQLHRHCVSPMLQEVYDDLLREY